MKHVRSLKYRLTKSRGSLNFLIASSLPLLRTRTFSRNLSGVIGFPRSSRVLRILSRNTITKAGKKTSRYESSPLSDSRTLTVVLSSFKNLWKSRLTNPPFLGITKTQINNRWPVLKALDYMALFMMCHQSVLIFVLLKLYSLITIHETYIYIMNTLYIKVISLM